MYRTTHAAAALLFLLVLGKCGVGVVGRHVDDPMTYVDDTDDEFHGHPETITLDYDNPHHGCNFSHFISTDRIPAGHSRVFTCRNIPYNTQSVYPSFVAQDRELIKRWDLTCGQEHVDADGWWSFEPWERPQVPNDPLKITPPCSFLQQACNTVINYNTPQGFDTGEPYICGNQTFARDVTTSISFQLSCLDSVMPCHFDVKAIIF